MDLGFFFLSFLDFGLFDSFFSWWGFFNLDLSLSNLCFGLLFLSYNLFFFGLFDFSLL